MILLLQSMRGGEGGRLGVDIALLRWVLVGYGVFIVRVWDSRVRRLLGGWGYGVWWVWVGVVRLRFDRLRVCAV